MAGESRMDEDITACESNKAGSARLALVEGPESIEGNTDRQQDSEKSKAKHESNKTVPFYKLFSFADSLDQLLMFIGTISAAGTGICMPLMAIITGEMIDAFGGNVNTKRIVQEVSKVSLNFVYLAVGSFVASSLQVACWMVTGERQSARIRTLYLKAILRQDIGFFDKETNSGDVVGRMSGDTVLIQEAMGEKVGRFIQLVVTFAGCFIVAFIKGWLMTLVMLSCVPPLIFSGAIISFIVAKMTTRGQAAYSAAAIVVEQTISSIRTVRQH